MNYNHSLFKEFIVLNQSQNFNIYNVSIDLPPHITSEGLWADYNHGGGKSPLQSPFTILQLQIVTIFFITQCCHFLLKSLGVPYFISSALAGILLGPTIKSDTLNKYKQLLFPFGSEDTLQLISAFGYTFYLFLNYVQMDYSMITRTGKRAWAIALSSLVPICLGFAFYVECYPFIHKAVGEKEINSMPTVFISHSICSFPVIASLLTELEILNSEIGRLTLSSALVLDITGTAVTGIATSMVVSSNKGLEAYIINVGGLIALFVIILTIGRPLMKLVVRHTQQGRPVKKIFIYIIVFLVIIFGLMETELVQPFFGGAVMLGLAVPEGPPLGSELVKQLQLFSTWFLMPLFVTSCIMKVDLDLWNMNKNLVMIIFGLIIMVTLVKILLCVGICQFCSMPIIDSICIALILSCKGVVDICAYILLYDAKRYTSGEVSIMVISGLILATISKIGVKSLYDPSRKYAGYQKRNILYLKPNTELRVVACVHKPCHIVPVRNSLDLFSPTPTNPLVVDVLHLMELIGRTSPIFISHRNQQMSVGSSHHNFSGEIIVTFSLYEHEYAGAATVNAYTAISPFTFMHDDICYLAMDKVASFIILPFHLRWRDDGTVESDNNNIRTLNIKVMEKAPCSIGILVNRGSCTSISSSYVVAMIFLGGSDDREALCLAKRSAKELNNHLFVYRLVGPDSETTNWDSMLDAEVLRGVQGTYGRLENVTFEQITIDDPSQITSFLNDVVTKFDYIIVGRRHGVKSPITSAMVNWTEFPELGVIGDLLASPDMETKASILVVQQQQMPTKW
ncbi:PREDICTED: cation/H(+) antiporter 4-like [Lupinus angustifolius]|nr:PREDICTED: cation/H(+) antiporter 4-like [Lupinus angustifolius]